MENLLALEPLQVIWDYLGLHQTLEKADCIVGFGNFNDNIARRAAELYHQGLAPKVLFTGGLGRNTLGLLPEPEAERFARVAMECGVPEADIIRGNYDDAVRLSRKEAAENGWIIVQDTSWPGYEEIPGWIMQGYCTMGLEAYEQLPQKPTHIFLQAGVGSMAAAIAALFCSIYGKDRPKIIIAEPNAADCFFRTAQADDGTTHIVTGRMNTIMAGLACGEPCLLAWEILRSCADHFIAFPDWAAAKGMRILGNPAGKDKKVISGESGAATFGCVSEIMLNPELKELKQRLQLDENSVVLFFSTEGDTDKENYRNVVWRGKYAKA